MNAICTDECCMAGKDLCMTTCDTSTTTTSPSNSFNTNELKPHSSDYQFDHLSVVSEENFTNSDGANSLIDHTTCSQVQTAHPQMSLLIHPLPLSTISNEQQPPPLTPVELVASQLNDLHNAVPPLSYFENIANEKMKDTPPVTTNGWDFSLQTPYQIVSLNSNVPGVATSPVMTAMTSTPITSPVLHHRIINSSPSQVQPQQQQNSPKHFFSTIKPRPFLIASPPPPSTVITEVPVSVKSDTVTGKEPIYAKVNKVGKLSQEHLVSFLVLLYEINQ